MKNYLNLDGLTHFLNIITSKFATKSELTDELTAIQENIITNEEIDAICGQNIENGTALSPNYVTLVDETTSVKYKLYVNNEKLTMMEVK